MKKCNEVKGFYDSSPQHEQIWIKFHCTAITTIQQCIALHQPVQEEWIKCITAAFLWLIHLLNCTALHCTALHCTALHCTELNCTAMHCGRVLLDIAQHRSQVYRS